MTAEQEYVPLPAEVMAAMPDATQVRHRLLNAMDEVYNGLVEARGKVRQVEDTYAVQRKLASWHEQAKGLKAAFDAARKRTLELMEDELVAVAGEQSGIPNQQAITVPDAAGDIRVRVKTENVHTIDADQLMSVVAAVTLADGGPESLTELVTDVVNGDHAEYGPEQLPDLLAEMLLQAMRTLVACGAFEPQVSKTRAYAAQVARDGNDNLAAVLSGAINTHRVAKGVEMTRKGL